MAWHTFRGASFIELLSDADQVTILVTDIKIAAAVILIFDRSLNCHVTLLQLRVHCVDVVNIDVECPVLVERDRMRRARFVEEDCYPLAPDDTECRRLAKKFARVKSELFAVKCFTRHYVLDFNRGGAVDDVYHRRNSITLKVG